MCKNKAEAAVQSMQEHINKFDNKASILITIVGIIFALSLGILDTFNQFDRATLTCEMQVKYYLLIGLSSQYFISFAVELIFLLLVIFPRKKKNGEISVYYYMDVAGMDTAGVRALLDGEDSEDNKSMIDQILVNARICKSKHKNLVIAIWCLIPLFVCMFAVFFVAIV